MTSHLFSGKAQLTTETYPADLDTTAVGWTAGKEADTNDIHSVIDTMLKYRNEDGIIQVGIDTTSLRTRFILTSCQGLLRRRAAKNRPCCLR